MPRAGTEMCWFHEASRVPRVLMIVRVDLPDVSIADSFSILPCARERHTARECFLAYSSRRVQDWGRSRHGCEAN